MYTRNRKQSASRVRGFTIIEMLIVLAVAGFVLIIVLVALPALQRNSRNYQRKHGAELVASSLEQYKTNNGDYPRTEEEFENFLDSTPELTKGPLRVEYRTPHSDHEYWPEEDSIAVQYAHWCNIYGNGSNDTDPIAGDDISLSFYAVWTQLEPDGTEPEDRNTFCVDNYYK